MNDVDPFAALGLAPTLERDAIKHAYFAAVRRSPPHADPEGFRRVRAAYEQLNDGVRLLRAWLQAPLAVDRELEHWDERWRARIEAARAGHRTQEEVDRSIELLVDRCFRMRLGPPHP